MKSTESLLYAFEKPPPLAGCREVAPGVLWLRMPLPGALDHINVWALSDRDGWTLVDTGLQMPEVEAAWQRAFVATLDDRPIVRVICTHMHPDHIGMAGWLTRRFDCVLWMTRLEYLTCRVLVADTGREAPSDGVRFYRAAGWSEEALEDYKARFGGFGKGVYALPDSYRRVSDGDEIEIGGRLWRAIIGRGHSPEHLCLYCPQLDLMISGDQVLPRITSNVSLFPTEPEADPLSDWLASIASLKDQIPDEVLVLPSHGEPFRGLHARLEQLNAWHEETLQRLIAVLREPKRAIDVFGVMFRRTIDAKLLSLATGESLAHINCLIHRGRAVRELDAHGTAWFRAI